MATVQQLVDAVLEDGQFDAVPAQVLRWLDTRHQQMCARSRCFRETLDLGVTGAGVDTYALPAGIVEILEVRVGAYLYGSALHRDFAEGALGYLWLGGIGGVAGREDTAAGVTQLRIFPGPRGGLQPEPGAAIAVYAVMQPPALSPADDSTLKIPADYTDALVSGAIATGMLRVESRGDIAAKHEAIFEKGCAELMGATNRKFRGSGPALIRVIGVNA